MDNYTPKTIVEYASNGIILDVPVDTKTFLEVFEQEAFKVYQEHYPITEQTKFATWERARVELKEFVYEIIEYKEHSIWGTDAFSPIATPPKVEHKRVPADWWRRGRDYRLAYVPELDTVFSV